MSRFQVAVGALLLALGLPAASAQTPVTVVNVWAAETGQFSHFGTDVRLLGDLLVIGAERQQTPGQPGLAVGTVYAFRQTGEGPYGGYAEEAQLRLPFVTPTGLRPGGGYGFAVDACAVPGGDTFVVGGAPNESVPNPANPNRYWRAAGAAYVHRRDATTGAWSLDGRLAVPNPRDDAHGGTAVGIACEPGAAPGDPPTVEAIVWVDTRLVVWHRDAAGAWTMRQTIPLGVGAFPSSGTVVDVFVVSPPGPAAARPALLIGTQVWRRTGPEATPWVQEGLVTPPRGPDDLFSGRDIDRDLIVIGSEYAPLSGPSAGGRAHVYRYTGTGPLGGWEEEAVLTPAVPRERFGFTVAVWAGPAGDGAGARVAVRSARGLTTFRRTAPGVWREEVLLEQGAPPQPWTGVLGGVNDRHIAVGNYLDNRRGAEAGIVHLLDLRSVVAAEGVPGAAAAGLAVSGANPVRSRGEVTLTLAAAAPVTVALFDALGRRVAVLHEGALGAGATRLGVDVSGLPAGVYVVRASGGASASVRLSVVR